MMTDKAQAVLQKALRLFHNPQARARVLDQFNRENLDDVGPVGGEQGFRVQMQMKHL
jgi:hypothetical protein